jgi:hypothetical protein
MGGCLLLLFFSRRIAASAASGQHFHVRIMAFPPDLTEKARFPQGDLKNGELFFFLLSVA